MKRRTILIFNLYSFTFYLLAVLFFAVLVSFFVQLRLLHFICCVLIFRAARYSLFFVADCLFVMDVIFLHFLFRCPPTQHTQTYIHTFIIFIKN